MFGGLFRGLIAEVFSLCLFLLRIFCTACYTLVYMNMNEIPLDSSGQPVLDDAQGVIASVKAAVSEGKKDPKRFDLRYDIGITGHAASPALDAAYKDSQATRESYALPAYSKESHAAEADSRVNESHDGEVETSIKEPKPSEHSPQDSVANNQSAVESASIPPEGDTLRKETERLESKVYHELKSLREAREAAGLAPNTMAEIDALPVGESVRKLKALRKALRASMGDQNLVAEKNQEQEVEGEGVSVAQDIAPESAVLGKGDVEGEVAAPVAGPELFTPAQYAFVPNPVEKLDKALDQEDMPYRGAPAEMLATNLTFSFWEKKAEALKAEAESMGSRFSKHYAVVEVITYLENIKSGNFFYPVHIPGRDPSNAGKSIDKSVYAYFSDQKDMYEDFLHSGSVKSDDETLLSTSKIVTALDKLRKARASANQEASPTNTPETIPLSGRERSAFDAVSQAEGDVADLDAIVPGEDRMSPGMNAERVTEATANTTKEQVLSLPSFVKALGSKDLIAKLVRGTVAEADVAWDFQKRASPVRAGLTIGAGAGVALAPLAGGSFLAAPVLLPIAGASVIVYGGIKMLQALALGRKFKNNFGKSIRQALKGK